MTYLKRIAARVASASLICMAVYLTGCAAPTVIQSHRSEAAVAAEPASAVQHPNSATSRDMAHSSDGSLWVDGGSLSHMFINAKARQVGDIVTIKIIESSSASNQASTNTGRTTSMSVGLNRLFGIQNDYPDNAFFNPFAPVQSDYESEFDGSGSTARSGALSAYITARIVQVLPNGNLYLEGNREVRINNENQLITLTGTVRPRDINSNNVVRSTYIADARISYSGSGVLNDQQRPGWLARILDGIWPF